MLEVLVGEVPLVGEVLPLVGEVLALVGDDAPFFAKKCKTFLPTHIRHQFKSVSYLPLDFSSSYMPVE